MTPERKLTPAEQEAILARVLARQRARPLLRVVAMTPPEPQPEPPKRRRKKAKRRSSPVAKFSKFKK